ncbi:MAG: hypothetical protein ACRD8A_13210 [Candidatus Acidiferrales bacterium]
MRLIWRSLLWLVCASIVAGLTVLIGIRVERHVLRRHAEALMADMQSITLRETTFQQVQPIFRRWRRWGKFIRPCSPARCEFDIRLHDLDSRPDRYLYRDHAVFQLASLVGESPTAISARIGVLNGVVSSEQIGFAIETPGHLLSAQTASSPRIDLPRGAHSTPAPNYAVWSPPNFPDMVRLEFTPSADPSRIHRLMAIDFSCLTRWRPCQSRDQIMPAAMSAAAAP